MGQKLKIARASPQNAFAIAMVHISAWRGAYRDLMGDEILNALDTGVRAKAWGEILSNETWPCYMVLNNNKTVGFIHISACRDPDKAMGRTGEVTASYIHPDHWRNGYGSLLLKRGLLALHDRGFSTVTLWVLDGNVPARKFYERHAFVPDGKKKVHPTSKLEEVRYINSVS